MVFLKINPIPFIGVISHDLRLLIRRIKLKKEILARIHFYDKNIILNLYDFEKPKFHIKYLHDVSYTHALW